MGCGASTSVPSQPPPLKKSVTPEPIRKQAEVKVPARPSSAPDSQTQKPTQLARESSRPASGRDAHSNLNTPASPPLSRLASGSGRGTDSLSFAIDQPAANALAQQATSGDGQPPRPSSSQSGRRLSRTNSQEERPGTIEGFNFRPPSFRSESPSGIMAQPSASTVPPPVKPSSLAPLPQLPKPGASPPLPPVGNKGSPQLAGPAITTTTQKPLDGIATPNGKPSPSAPIAKLAQSPSSKNIPSPKLVESPSKGKPAAPQAPPPVPATPTRGAPPPQVVQSPSSKHSAASNSAQQRTTSKPLPPAPAKPSPTAASAQSPAEPKNPPAPAPCASPVRPPSAKQRMTMQQAYNINPNLGVSTASFQDLELPDHYNKGHQRSSLDQSHDPWQFNHSALHDSEFTMEESGTLGSEVWDDAYTYEVMEAHIRTKSGASSAVVIHEEVDSVFGDDEDVEASRTRKAAGRQ